MNILITYQNLKQKNLYYGKNIIKIYNFNRKILLY